MESQSMLLGGWDWFWNIWLCGLWFLGASVGLLVSVSPGRAAVASYPSFCLIPDYVVCVPFMWILFSSPLGTPESKPHCHSIPDALGLIFLVQDFWVGEFNLLELLTPFGSASAVVTILLFVKLLLGGIDWTISWPNPFYLSQFDFFLCILVVEDLSGRFGPFFNLWLFFKLLWWCLREKRSTQGLLLHLSGTLALWIILTIDCSGNLT